MPKILVTGGSGFIPYQPGIQFIFYSKEEDDDRK